MFKRYIYFAAISFASITCVAAAQNAFAEGGMQVRKFAPPPGLEEPQTPETAKEVPKPASITEEEQNITEAEDEVWKKYKTLSSNDSRPEKKQKTVTLGKDKDKKEKEEDSDNTEGKEEDEEAKNAAFNINDILKKYKKDNKAKMNSRSFATPETIKSMGDGKDNDPEKYEEIPEEEIKDMNLNE